MPTITVPGHGDVEFPDSMSDADITAALKKLSPPSTPEHGRLANAVHETASYLPMAGGIAGGALGAGAGAPTGPGAILLSVLGAGLLGGAGKGLQRAIDSGLGYDNPTVMDVGKDAAKSAAGEALGAGGGAVAGELVGMGSKALAGPLRRLALGTTKRILRNTGGSLSAAKPLGDEAAQEVLDSGIVKTFGTSRGAAERLSQQREATGDAYGKIVKALKDKGIAGSEVEPLAEKYAAEEAAVNANTMNPAVPQTYATAAEQLRGKPVDAQGRLDLVQQENLKRSLQDQARSAYKQLLPNEVGKAHEDAASMMRQAVEDEIAKQTAPMVVAPETKAIAAQFEPVKQQAGRLIEADNIAQAGMARAANRHLISPADIAAFVGEHAHSGNPLRSAGAALLMHLARTRGPSTVAVAANGMANAAEDPASRILLRLGAGSGSAAGPSLIDLLEQIRQERAQAAGQ
jgi:hypothetical protein